MKTIRLACAYVHLIKNLHWALFGWSRSQVQADNKRLIRLTECSSWFEFLPGAHVITLWLKCMGLKQTQRICNSQRYLSCNMRKCTFQHLCSAKIQISLHTCAVTVWLPSSLGISTLVLLNLDMPCLCKQCRSRSVCFFRSQLIWICTVC